MKGFMKLVLGFVGITIALLMTANVVMPTIFGTSTTVWVDATNHSKGILYQWDAGATALWGILGIIAVASVIGVMFV